MNTNDKTILHYEVIANTAHKIEKVAHKIEKVAKELAALYSNSILDTRKAEIRNKALEQYIKELIKIS